MKTSAYARAFGIGAVSGLRSMSGLAATQLRAGGAGALIVPLLAFGELIADKLPGTPARTIPPALLFRAFTGGFAGGAVAKAADGDRAIGALCGAVGAIAGAYAGLQYRTYLSKTLKLPDFAGALTEDLMAGGAAYLLVR